MNLAVLAPNPNDATSFYRSMGPLSRLMKDGVNLEVSLLDERRVDWWNLRHCHAILMQRPSTSTHVKIAHTAADMSIPIWVDYDDYLWDVPASNPAAQFYGHETRHCMNELCRLADIITVSTAHLKSLIGAQNQNIRVIKNTVSSDLMARDSKQLLISPKAGGFMWRGSSTPRQAAQGRSQSLAVA